MASLEESKAEAARVEAARVESARVEAARVAGQPERRDDAREYPASTYPNVPPLSGPYPGATAYPGATPTSPLVPLTATEQAARDVADRTDDKYRDRWDRLGSRSMFDRAVALLRLVDFAHPDVKPFLAQLDRRLPRQRAGLDAHALRLLRRLADAYPAIADVKDVDAADAYLAQADGEAVAEGDRAVGDRPFDPQGPDARFPNARVPNDPSYPRSGMTEGERLAAERTSAERERVVSAQLKK